MAMYLRGTENRVNEATFAWDNFTFELVPTDSKRNGTGNVDFRQNLLQRGSYRLCNAEHLFDVICTGEQWVKSRKYDLYIRVLRPSLFKEYVVEAWWNGRLYKISKVYGDENVYINDKRFIWEKGEGEIRCVGIYEDTLYFWLQGRVEPQKVSERFGEKHQEPTDYKMSSDYFNTVDNRCVQLDYKNVCCVTDTLIKFMDTQMSYFAYAESEVTLQSQLKLGVEYVTSEMVNILRALINKPFLILMVDSDMSFEKDDKYVMTKLMGCNEYYYHNPDDGRLMFTLNKRVYDIPIRSLIKDCNYMVSTCLTSGSVMIVQADQDIYVIYGSVLFRIEGSSLYEVVTGNEVYNNCISDLTVEAMNRQFILSNA